MVMDEMLVLTVRGVISTTDIRSIIFCIGFHVRTLIIVETDFDVIRQE